jgi:hypothetical protein
LSMDVSTCAKRVLTLKHEHFVSSLQTQMC